MKLFEGIRERLEKSAPVEKWTGHMNYPFNGVLDKPRPSLSKHEGTDRGSNYLHCDDLIWILTARRDIPKLLEALDIAVNALNKIKDHSSIMGWRSDHDEAYDALEKMDELCEKTN